MTGFMKKDMYKVVYLILFLALTVRILIFEAQIAQDRKSIQQNETVNVSCTIISVPEYSNDTVSFFANCSGEAALKTNILVKIKHGSKLKLTIGDRLSLRGVLSLPRKPLNPGGFDYGSYLKSKGASVILDTDTVLIKAHRESVLKPLYGIRSKITEKIFTYISPEEASLINALVTGSKSEMPEERKESFRRAGVYHIIAVSGLHLGMLLLFLSALYMNFRLKMKHRRTLSMIVTLGGCGFLLIFTGFGISVQRAAVMALTLSLSLITLREYSPFVSLFTVLAAVLFTEPGAYLDVSAQLSFSATFGVLFALRLLKKYNLTGNKFKPIIESALITQCANIFTLPFIVYQFGYVSLIGLVSNLIILIFVPLLLLLSYIFGVVSLIAPDPICRFAAGAVTAPAYTVNFLTDLFGNLKFAYIPIRPTDIVLTGLEIFFIYCFLKSQNRKLKYLLASLFIVANVAFISYNTLSEEAAVSFINVGQGDCTLIDASDGSAFMIDCGSETEYSIAENEVIPYLNRQGIRKLDILFITHFHEDHISGVIPLMENGFVKKIAVPARLTDNDEKDNANAIFAVAAKYNIPIYFTQKGDRLSYRDKHTFEIIHPAPSYRTTANNGSLVINYTYGGASLLFCGDTEGKAQYTIQNALPDCDILKVAHHGAYSPMSDIIYSKTTPEYAVISCGKDNKYNHPAKETLKSFGNSRILRTDISGPVVFKIKKGKVIKWKPN